jgi:esterase/lipase superfamily enzyme
MEMLVFGHAGEPIVVFPTSGGRYFEWQDFGMVDALRDRIDEGKAQLFCLDSVDNESWYAKHIPPPARIARDEAFDAYLLREVVPFVRSRSNRPITLAGASFGAYHVIDKGLRHPDVFSKLLALSGAYEMHSFLSGYESLGTYLRQPLQYLPSLSDAWFLDRMREQTILLVVGSHDFLFDQNVRLAKALGDKGIGHLLDVWQGEPHDWPAWRKMVRKHVF